MVEVLAAGDGFAVEWTGVDTRRRRIVFEPRPSGGYCRIEQRRTASGEWVETGNEIVADVDVSAAAEVV